MPIHRAASGIYYIDVTVVGQRIQRSAGTKDRRQAQELHDKVRNDLWRQQNLGEQAPIAWEEAAGLYLAEKAGNRTIAQVGRQLSRLAPYLDGKLCADIRYEDIRKILDGPLSQCAGKKDGKKSDTTKNRYLAAVSAVLHQAHKLGRINGVPYMQRRKETGKRLRWLTKEEAARLIAELPDHLKGPARFAIATGLRRENVSRLEWGQIDMAAKTAWVYSDQAKGKRDLQIPLNDEALAVLRAAEGRHHRVVFTAPDGSPLGSPYPRSFKEAAKRAGVPWCLFHHLRHTFGSWHAQAGTPLKVIKELMGIQDYKTVEIYAKLAPSHLAEWAGNSGSVTEEPRLRVVR